MNLTTHSATLPVNIVLPDTTICKLISLSLTADHDVDMDADGDPDGEAEPAAAPPVTVV